MLARLQEIAVMFQHGRLSEAMCFVQCAPGTATASDIF
jgi:hypothetical protein